MKGTSSKDTLKISKFTTASVALLEEELPLAQWSMRARQRLEMALELVSYGIDVYLIEWEGDSRIGDILPGSAIGDEIVGPIEGPHVWSQRCHIFATNSSLIDFMDKRTQPWVRRQKELIY